MLRGVVVRPPSTCFSAEVVIDQPFLSLYTPTFRRPHRLAACLASVAAQTLVSEIEQIVIPDHVGLGVGGMYAQIPRYAAAVHGRYVHILADDDVLAASDVVARVKAFARAQEYPPVLIVKAEKAEHGVLPYEMYGPPVEGRIDLGCVITRGDIWHQHVRDYGSRYEGDYDFASAVFGAGHEFRYADILFLRGAVMRGQAEAAA